MKKKHIGFITLLLVLLLGLSLSTCSYAAGTRLSYIQINATDDQVYDALIEHFNLNTSSPIENNLITYEQYKSDWVNHNGIKLFFSENNYNVGLRSNFVWGTNNINGNTDPSGFRTNSIVITNYHMLYNMYSSGNTKKYYYTGSSTTQSLSGSQGYFLVKDKFGQWFEFTQLNWSITDYQFPASISFNAYNDGNISVNYNGISDSFLKFNISRSVPQWSLGRVEGLSGDMRVDIKLNRYMNSEFTTLVGHAQWYCGQRTSSGGLSIAADGVVYIDNTKLFYNQGYYLTLDLEGENVDNYPLYFLPYASTATSGDLLSPDIDTNSDLEILQNIQDLVNIQNMGAIYDNYFSGDSGDVLGTLGYNDYNNQYQLYMADILNELHNVLMTSGDVSVNVSLMGVPMTLHSSDYTVPNNAIKIFCNSFLTFGLFYYIYKTAVHFFHQLQEGNFVGAVNTYTVDDESVYM